MNLYQWYSLGVAWFSGAEFAIAVIAPAGGGRHVFSLCMAFITAACAVLWGWAANMRREENSTRSDQHQGAP